jgi:hypothetical protein
LVRVFADEELARLREFPETGREELFRLFTLSPADLAFVDPGRGRGPADRLGIAYLISARVIRPGPVSMVERIAHAREQAQRETYDRLAHESPRHTARSWTRCW